LRWETRHGARTSSEVSRRAQRPSSLRFADRLAEASSTEHKPQDDQDNNDDDEPIQHGLLLIRYLEGTNHATPSRLAMLRPLVSHPQGGIFLHSIKRHASWLVIAGGILCVIVLAVLVKSVTGGTSSSGCDPQNCAVSASGSGKLKGDDPMSPNKYYFQAWDHSAVNYSYDCHGKSGQFWLTLWTNEYPVGDAVQYNALVLDSGTGKSGIERFDAPSPVHWNPDVNAPSYCDWSFTITKQ
jgi:hypothetical protein